MKNKTKTMSKKTLQQVEREILEGIKDTKWGSDPGRIINLLKHWQNQLKDLSKEEKHKKDLREKIFEILKGITGGEFTQAFYEKHTDKILTLLETQSKEKDEKIEKIGLRGVVLGSTAVIRDKIDEIIDHLNSHPNIGGE